MSQDPAVPQDVGDLVDRALSTVERLRRVTDTSQPEPVQPGGASGVEAALHRLATGLERCERSVALLHGEVQAVHDRLERAEARLDEAVGDVTRRGEALHLALLADVERLVARLGPMP